MMTNHNQTPRGQSADTLAQFKTQAKRLRDAMGEQGSPLSHSAALELVARQHGHRDWNTLAAATPVKAEDRPATLSFGVGEKVRGRYLNQPFTGKVLSLTEMPSGGLYRVVVHFDEPVDVVTFDSFSAFRRRINAVIGRDGISPRQTSNGLPHLVIEA